MDLLRAIIHACARNGGFRQKEFAAQRGIPTSSDTKAESAGKFTIKRHRNNFLRSNQRSDAVKFIQLTLSDDEPIWVNMEHVHLVVRSGDLTVLQFATAARDETVTVKEPPHDIFPKI